VHAANALPVALSAVALFAVAGACGTSTAPPDAGGVTPSGPQPIGAPCDPSIPMPCVPTGDPCLGVLCGATRVCTQFVTDAGPPCSSGASPCTTSADCDQGLSCGFPVGAGCAAQGQCIDAPLLCENDAAACVTPGPACGCDGLPDPYVAPGYATSPASSPGACAADAGAVPDDAAAQP
jgi:hypothetical protein